jgi:GT2 family glycosyltransferase
MTDISVVIPTFRRPALLSEAITSALADDTVSVEVTVIDDSPEGSARATVERIGDPRVTYMKNEPPSGGNPARVRNRGWPAAKGTFVHFLDDDDRVASGFYRSALDAGRAHPDRGVVFGRIEPFGDDPKALEREHVFFEDAARRARLAARMPTRHWVVANLLFMNTVLVNSSCLIRRECIEPLGGYNPDIPMNEDIDFYGRAIRKFGWIFLDEVVLHYRVLSDSLMHGRSDDSKLLDAYGRMYSRYKETYGAAELFALKLFARTILRVL